MWPTVLAGVNSGCWLPTVTEHFVIPDKFEGPVLVIFDCPDGVELEIQGHVRRIEIPSTGMLFVINQSPGTSGISFSITQADGTERAIELSDAGNQPGDVVSVMGFRSYGDAFMSGKLVSRRAAGL